MSDVLQRLGDAIKMLRERDADLARLTTELDNAKIAIDGLQNTLRKEREQHHKAQDDLERKQREVDSLRSQCEGLREVFASAERNERHQTNAETRYWCEQYKQIARAALSAGEKT